MYESDIKVYGIKTDCLLIKEQKQEIKINFNKDIGGVKFESGKKPINKKIMFLKNELIEFIQPQVNVIEMKDEYDIFEMKDILQKYDKVMIKGLLPGSGKTTAVKNSGYDVLFVTPYNKLCQELRKEIYDSVTLNKLLNIDICGNYNKYSTSYNIDSDAVCFDEILLYNPGYLNKINSFMNRTDKKVYATGDMDQLQPFGYQLNNVIDKKDYLNRIINMMFPNQIVLKYNKRLRTKEDQQMLYQIKKDIFNVDLDVATTMKKYFRAIYRLSEITTTTNLSYFNFRGEKINKHVQNNNIKVPKDAMKIDERDDYFYYKGLELVCKKYYKIKNIRLYTNYSYILKDITSRKFTVIEPVDEVEIKLDINLLKKHFNILL